jgi:hypothetical protein
MKKKAQLAYRKSVPQCRLLYVGPLYSGKSSNLHFLANNGRLFTPIYSTAAFDLTYYLYPDKDSAQLLCQLFCLTGKRFHYYSNRHLLQNMDGFVFVADSQRKRFDANMETLMDVQRILLETQDIELSSFPHIFQYNKQDLKEALDVNILRQTLNITQVEDIEAQAHRGDGVEETLNALCKSVLHRFAHPYA